MLLAKLLSLCLLALALAGCGSVAPDEYHLGERFVEPHELEGSWSFARAHLPEDVECVKWDGGDGADLSCLEPLGLKAGMKVSSTRAGGGWSTASIGGKAFCIKWEAKGEQGALACFPQAGYRGQAATVRSHKGPDGWSASEVTVPGEGLFTCVKWETYSGGKTAKGAGALSCHQRLDGDGGPVTITSTKLAGGWSVARVSFGKANVCLKWQGSQAAGMSCRLEERRYHGEPVAIASLKFGSTGWSTQAVELEGYAPLRCLKWSDSHSGGVSCFRAAA